MNAPALGDPPYRQVVERMRRVRTLRGGTASTVALAPRRWRRPYTRRWIGVLALWALCIVGNASAAWRVRTAPAQQTPVISLSPRTLSPWEQLVRDRLIHDVIATPDARIAASAGTAEVAAWSPNGRYLAVGYSAGSLLIWDAARGRRAAWVRAAHRRFVNALAWSPDGRLLVSAAPDGKVMLWQLSATGHLTPRRTLRIVPHPPNLPAVAISPTGAQLAIADGLHTISLWSIPALLSGTRRRADALPAPQPRRLRVAGHTTALAWSADGAYLAAGTREGRVLLWPTGVGGGRVTRSLGSSVWALAWSPAAPLLAAGGANGLVTLLAAPDLQVRRRLAIPFGTKPVYQVPNFGKPLPAQTPQVLAGPAINGLGWSPSGDVLGISAVGVPLRLWQPSTGSVVATYQEDWDMNAVAWRPDGRHVAVATDDGSVVLLRVADPTALIPTRLCHLAGPRWCNLLGYRPGSAGGATPPSYMSR